jgi:hypothetical protein
MTWITSANSDAQAVQVVSVDEALPEVFGEGMVLPALPAPESLEGILSCQPA